MLTTDSCVDLNSAGRFVRVNVVNVQTLFRVVCVLLLCVEAFLPHGADDGRVRAQVRGRALGGHERDRRTETEHTARLTVLKSTDPQHSNRQQTDGADS